MNLDFNHFEKTLQISNELVSNSHVSFESALYFYELISKIPNEILAVGITKRCLHPLGIFRYINLRNCSYQKGVLKISTKNYRIISIASKEKAIADILVRSSTPKFRLENDVENFLANEIGIKKAFLNNLDDSELINLRLAYNKFNVSLLARLYSKMDGGKIWVADLPRLTTEEELSILFKSYGEVQSVTIRQDPLGILAL